MSFQIRPARRANVPLVIGLPGPSGGGKTFSALLLARGLAGTDGQIVAIDTENGRAQMYSDVGAPWQWMGFGAPFTPERYVEAIGAAEAASPAVIVLDSVSHEYDGEGGMNDIVEAYLQQRAGSDEEACQPVVRRLGGSQEPAQATRLRDPAPALPSRRLHARRRQDRTGQEPEGQARSTAQAHHDRCRRLGAHL
jgi:hypothetical protein